MKINEYKTVLDSDGRAILKVREKVEIDGRKAFNNPALMADFFSNSVGIGNCAEEYVYVGCFNAKMRLIGCFEASHGSVNASMFPVREILQKSLLIGAVYIAISHNHPSGDISPSNEDIAATKRIKEAANIVCVPVVDHVIVSGSHYYSFAENGTL